MPGSCLDRTNEMASHGSVLNALEVKSVSCCGDANTERDAAQNLGESIWFEDVTDLSEMPSCPDFCFGVFDLEKIQRSVPHKLKIELVKYFQKDSD